MHLQIRKCLPWFGLVVFSVLAIGCATTGGSGSLPPPIPEGKGHLVLEAGGINQMNFYVIDQETEELVFSYTPRPSARSPSAFERGTEKFGLHTYLDPGIYTVVANTDFEDSIEIPDQEIKLGEVTWVPVQVGRFMLNVTRNGTPAQVQFLLYDYSLRTVLGRGMTSTQVRHFIARPGIYKVRIEMLGAGIDQITDVEVGMGRVTPVHIELAPAQEEAPADQEQQQP